MRVRADARLPLANFARRLDQISIGLRLLRPQVFERPPADPRVRQAILAEYAILLLQNGSVQEAARLLAQVDRVIHPDIHMARAWCHFELWDYESAIPCWENYIAAQRDPYWKLLGQVNLAEALIATGSAPDGLAVLDAAIPEATQAGNTRLAANALHLTARAHFELKEIAKSDRAIAKALQLFSDPIASDAVLIRRQSAINRAFAEGHEKPLLKFRAEAERIGAWESIRECDYQRLKLNFRPELFANLYHGTPAPTYRTYLRDSFGVAPPAEYQWGDSAGPKLDLDLRRFRKKIMTRQNASLLTALLKDFYRPPNVGEIFTGLFDGESFDPATSPIRVHQAMRRLRRWLLETRVPLEIRHINNRYRVERTGPLALPIGLENPHSRSDESWRRLAGTVPANGIFAVRDVQHWFAISKATATRRLAQAEDRGLVERIGSGRATKYRLPTENERTARRNR